MLTKVLVIEDNPDDFILIRDLFREQCAISNLHFYLENARSAKEARAKLKLERWNFIIVDYYLGAAETGLDLIYSLHDAGRRYPALLLSGTTDIPVGPRTISLIQQKQLHFLSKDELCWNSLQHAIADKISRRFRVLIVDDDPDDVALFTESLRGDELTQFEVDHAPDSAQARTLLETRSYDVLLLDFRLENGLGTNLLFAIPEENLPTSAILCTGQDYFELDHRTLKMMGSGRLRFFSKSSLQGDALVKTILDSHQLLPWTESILPGATGRKAMESPDGNPSEARNS